MKKVLIVVVSSLLVNSLCAQEKKDYSKPSTTLFSGGIWVGSSMTQNIQIVGLMGPKLSVTFPLNQQIKVEAGVMGIPGLIIDKRVSKLGLSMGTVVILKIGKTKLKPVIGCVFIKTDKWHPLYGIGIQI